MKLPNAARAVVPERKIVAYLLNPAHTDYGRQTPRFVTAHPLPEL